MLDWGEQGDRRGIDRIAKSVLNECGKGQML